MDDEFDAFAWVDESALGVAACITVVRGVSEAQVIGAFAPSPDSGVHPAFDGPLGDRRWTDPYAGLVDGDASDLAARDRDVLWVLDLSEVGRPDELLIVEENGFAATRGEVIAALAAPEHVSAFWNVSAGPRLVVAESGRIVVNEEVYSDLVGPHIERLRAGLELDPTVPDYLPWARAVLVMLERATGVQVNADLLRCAATLVTLPDGPMSTMIATLERQLGDPPVGYALPLDPEPPAPSDSAFPLPGVSRPGAPGSVVTDPGFPEWYAPPGGWLPGQVAVEAVLGRSADVVVRLARLAAYPFGVELDVEIARRPGSLGSDGSSDLTQSVDIHGRVRPEALRIDLDFADGSRASTAAPYADLERRPQRPILGVYSGGGTDLLFRHTLWLWPLPPPGPVRVACSWTTRGISRQVTGLDGDAIFAAAARAEHLW